MVVCLSFFHNTCMHDDVWFVWMAAHGTHWFFGVVERFCPPLMMIMIMRRRALVRRPLSVAIQFFCCAIHMKNLIKIKSHHNHNSSHWFQNDWGARSTTIISQQQTHPNQSKQIKWNNSSIEKFFIIRVYLIIWVSSQLVVLFAGVMVVHILFIAAVTPMLLMFRQAGRHCCRWGGYYE